MKERLAVVEEKVRTIAENQQRIQLGFKEQIKECTSTFKEIYTRLDTVNKEQSETRDAITMLRTELKSLINERVSAPMSGKDRAVIYASLITATASIIIALIGIAPSFLG